MINANDFGLPAALYCPVSYSGGTGFSVSVKTGVGKLAGILVSTAANSPTLAVYDSTSASGSAIMSTFTPVAGTLYRFGANIIFINGLYVYSAGSVIMTVAYY